MLLFFASGVLSLPDDNATERLSDVGLTALYVVVELPPEDIFLTFVLLG